jgi:2-phospho-L-lactate/phosphoenolpyruvate guanylyltransferase
MSPLLPDSPPTLLPPPPCRVDSLGRLALVAVDAGLLPVKRLDQAKRRLAAHFGYSARIQIARALLLDALDLCGRTDFLSWSVVSDDRDVLATAERRGLGVVEDPGKGLNAALIRAVAGLAGKGARSVTVLPADVPLAFREDLEDVLDTGATSDVVVVPSWDDGGTNALFMKPPDLMPPRFGGASLRAHVEQASKLGARCSILGIDRLALDIDTIEDADEFLARKKLVSCHTERVLMRLRDPGREERVARSPKDESGPGQRCSGIGRGGFS